MKTVLYTYDLEPITIIDISTFAIEHLKKHGIVNLAVSTPVTLTPPDAKYVYESISCRRVTLRSVPLYLHNRTGMFLVTQDEESALLLKAAFLPGQTSELNELKRKAFAQGFLYALNKLTN